jgi:hypothetical protein
MDFEMIMISEMNATLPLEVVGLMTEMPITHGVLQISLNGDCGNRRIATQRSLPSFMVQRRQTGNGKSKIIHRGKTLFQHSRTSFWWGDVDRILPHSSFIRSWTRSLVLNKALLISQTATAA